VSVLRNNLRSFGYAIVVSLFFCIYSCGSDVLVGYNQGDASGGNGGEGGTTGTGLGGGSAIAGASSGDANASCANGGPSIDLPTLDGCTSDLAKRLFLFSICVCNDLSYNGTLMTSSLADTTTPSDRLGGSVGVNGAYQGSSVASQLGGALWVQGDAQMAEEDIAGDLKCGGTLTVGGVSKVQHDTYVAGNVDAPELTIDGALYVPEGSSVNVQSALGGTFRQSVSVKEPCECNQAIDVAALTTSFRKNNDNEREALTATSLTTNEQKIVRSLPCGRYYFDAISESSAITLSLTGKSVIAIDGNLDNVGGLSILLGDDAELDLFISGDVNLSGPVVIGRRNRPSATRIYVGGRVAFSSNPVFYANWYVPNSPFVISSKSELWGALHVQSLELSGSLTLHYDPTILELPSCTPSGQSCSSCRDCSNPTPACRNGTCAACSTDGDCCPPLRCNRGLCELETILL
jgi:hypothetical protein